MVKEEGKNVKENKGLNVNISAFPLSSPPVPFGHHPSSVNRLFEGFFGLCLRVSENRLVKPMPLDKLLKIGLFLEAHRDLFCFKKSEEPLPARP